MAEETPPTPPTPRKPGLKSWKDIQSRRTAAQVKEPRRRQALFLAGIILALAGIVAALLFFLRPVPRPVFVGIVIDANRDVRIPPSPWSARDRDALAELSWQPNPTVNAQDRALLLQRLRELGQGVPSGSPLVIYLRAYAAVKDDGTVCLLPADSFLDAPDGWLPVKEVLEILKGCPVSNRLLLLDLAQPLSEPRFGQLGHDVAERLLPILQDAIAKDEHLQILCACSPGQTSLVAEELGHSVFVHFLIEGLYGKADGALTGGKTDGTVTVKELAAYVTTRVDRWAFNNRNVRQTPMYLNAGADFALTVVDKEHKPAGTPLDAAYPEKLIEKWKLRDDWWQALQRTDPKHYLRLETVLLRADRQWRGGMPLEKVVSELSAAVDLVERDRRNDAPPDSGPPRSLGQEVARRGGKKPDVLSEDAARRKLLDLAVLRASAFGTKPNEDDKKQLKLDEKAFLDLFKDKPFELAWTIYQVAAHDDRPDQPDRPTLEYWYSLIDHKALKANDRDYAEIDFLRRLTELKVAKPAEWPVEAVRAALDLASEEGRLPSAIDPAFTMWVEKPIEAAKSKANSARKDLFGTDLVLRKNSSSKLTQAANELRDLNDRLETLTEARLEQDRALVYLPGYALYLEADPGMKEVWERALRDMASLRSELANGPGTDAGAAMGRVNTAKANMLESLKRLRQPLSPEKLGDLIKERQRGGQDDSLRMRVLLRLPVLSAPDRARLWGAWLPLAVRLSEQSGAGTEPMPTVDLTKGLREAAKLGLLRAQLSLALLRLNEAGNLDDLKGLLREAQPERMKATDWLELSKQLRLAWVASAKPKAPE